MEDTDLINNTCDQWLGADAPEAGKDSGEPKGGKKSASIQNNSNYSSAAWLVARDQLFNGGNVSYPNRFEVDDKKQSRTASVITNEESAPNWLKATYAYKRSNPPVEQQQTSMRNASMNDKRPAWLAARDAFLTRS